MNWRFWSRQDSSQPDTCASIEPLLSLFSDGMASPPEARRVESHLDECPDCRRALEWMEATRLVIAKRPAAVPPADLRMRIAQAIAAETAANTSFRPKPRSFVTHPAFAVAASLALVAAIGFSLDHSLKPNPVSVVPTRVPARIAGNKLPQLGVKPAAETPLPRVAIVTPSKKHSPLPQPILVRPQNNKPLVANLPDDTLGHVPQTVPVPVVHSQPLPPRVKPAPVKQQVAFKPVKPIPPHVTPLPVKHNQPLVAELPLNNDNGTMITPDGPSVEPNTTQIIQPEPSHTENVAIHVPSTDVLSIVHQHVLASLAASRTVTEIERDPNAHVQMASYHSGGLSNDSGRPFVTAPAVYTPTSLPVSKAVVTANIPSNK